MLGRKKLGYRECLCRNCEPGPVGRKYMKTRTSNRISRRLGKLEIQDQYDDHRFGTDPD